MPLIPQLVKGKNLENLLNAMSNKENHDPNTFGCALMILAFFLD